MLAGSTALVVATIATGRDSACGRRVNLRRFSAAARCGVPTARRSRSIASARTAALGIWQP
jgi:hypothetical protein